MVERNLAKVEVAGSIPVIRSRKKHVCFTGVLFQLNSLKRAKFSKLS